MKNTLPIIIIGAALLCSCEKRFELHPENYSNMIRLECVADADNDSVYIFPSICVPTQVTLRDRNRNQASVEITGLGIEIDGQYHQAVRTEYHETEIVWDEEYNNDDFIVHTHEEVVTKYRWAVPGSVPEGASLKIKASAVGTEPVYGETVVPAKPQIGVTCTPYEYTEGFGDDKWTTQYLKVKIDVTDKANDTGYYALQIMQKRRYVRQYTDEGKELGLQDVDETTLYSTTPEKINESTFDDMESDSGITLGYDGYRLSYYYSGPLCIYKSAEIDGQEMYIRVNPDYIVTGNPLVIKNESRTEYQVRLFRISQEVFRYAKAYNLEGNELSEAGLAPVNFTYSNIIGGSGYFGSFTCAESGWIENPFVMETEEGRYY